MISVTGLNHVVLYVRELDRSVNFYKSISGFEEVVSLHGMMAFLRAADSTNYHDLGLIALGF
jgi:catechol 2,3-dioxygenase-like lactoylglutathione lyase family enzyme